MKQFSRYERQFILKEIGREGQRLLDKSRVAVVGLGALGSVSANLLARAGIGRMLLIDRDFIEMNNLQRQVLYDEKDLKENLPKAVAAKQKLEEINSEIKVECSVSDVNPNTIHELLGECDLIVDGTDNFETRFLLNDYSLARTIPWIYGGAVRTEGMSYVILPGETPCLRCLFGEAPGPGDAQTCDQVGILAPVAHMIASFQAVEAIKILAKKKKDVDRRLWKMDIWNREFQAINVEHLRNTPCEACRDEKYIYLQRIQGTRAVALCGQNAVQITTSYKEKINFKKLAAKMALAENIQYNEYLFRCHWSRFQVTLFVNGRAIVKGTENPDEAKSVYSKLIGL